MSDGRRKKKFKTHQILSWSFWDQLFFLIEKNLFGRNVFCRKKKFGLKKSQNYSNFILIILVEIFRRVLFYVEKSKNLKSRKIEKSKSRKIEKSKSRKVEK